MDIGYIIIAFTLIVLILAMSIVIFVSFFQKRSMKNKLEKVEMKAEFNEKLIRQTIKAQDEEKSRIGKELHDNINGLMMLAKLNIQKLKLDNTKDALNTIDEAMGLTRDLSHNLAFSSLENFGLKHTLESFVARISRNVNYNISLNYNIEENIENEVSQQILRITQEAVMNINKYAEASKVLIELNLSGDNSYQLIIEDDGRGFDVNNEKNGIGLHNMKIRAESIDGKLEIISETNKGSSIILTFLK